MQHFQSAIFESNLLELGEQGFTDWLISSFCGTKIGPLPGNFHFDEENYFGVIFAEASTEFSNTNKLIVGNAVRESIVQFSRNESSLENLMNLAAIGEIHAPILTAKNITEIISYWFSREPNAYAAGTKRLLCSTSQAYCLQQTLEIAVRLLSLVETRPELDEPLSKLGDWAHYQLSAPLSTRELVPAWGTMAQLALFSLIREGHPTTAKVNQLVDVLRIGFQEPASAFPELYIFKEEHKSYPYDFSQISSWIINSAGGKIARPSAMPALYQHDPLGLATTKFATTLEQAEFARECIDDMKKELVA